MLNYKSIPSEVYEEQQRRAGEQMQEHVLDLRKRILEVAPEAVFLSLDHDYLDVACNDEHAEAVLKVLNGGRNGF